MHVLELVITIHKLVTIVTPVNINLQTLQQRMLVPIAEPANTKIKMVKAHALDALRVALEKDKRLIVLRRRIVYALKMNVHVPMVLMLQELLVLHMARSCAHRAILDILVLCAP